MHDPTEVLPRRRAQESNPDPMLGRVIDGRYRLAKVLGRGAMGAVYGARHEVTDRDVAVKLIPSPLDARAHERRQRFFREVRAPARIHHPAMVEVLDAGESEGMLYLVMELLEGEDLSQVIARGPLQWSQIRQWIDEVLDALQAAHQAGFVHRDIKPANIFVCRDGSIKLLDFGVVKQDGHALPALTADGAIIGTPWYMSPEQAAAEDSGPATDIWAVGAVIFHALAGQPPVCEDKPIDTITAIVKGEVRRLSEMDVDVSDIVCAVVDRAMAHDIEDRFPSASAMKAALRPAKLGEATVGTDAGGWDSATAAITNVAMDTNVTAAAPRVSHWPALLLGLLLGVTTAGAAFLWLTPKQPASTVAIESIPAKRVVPDDEPSAAILLAQPADGTTETTDTPPATTGRPEGDVHTVVPAEAPPPLDQADKPSTADKKTKTSRKRRARRTTKRKKVEETPKKKLQIIRDYE